MTSRWRSLAILILGTLLLAGHPAGAQLPAVTPPRETPLVEKKLEEIDATGISADGQAALKINPTKWHHAETPNFYIHFRRMTEARKVAREVEFDLVVVANALQAAPESYTRKSHVYVFEDESEWQVFIAGADVPEWTASYAKGDELFLNIRQERGGTFDSQTLAHETTHAVVARIYQHVRWPLWLNEGFAEYMGSAAVAKRKNQLVGRHQNKLAFADLSLAELTALTSYPSTSEKVTSLYQTSEKVVRFLMMENPPERFVPLAKLLAEGKTLAEAVPAIYADKYPTFADFEKAWRKFSERK